MVRLRSGAATREVAGGFVLAPVAGLMAAWQDSRRGTLRAGDFRTWLACREMAARRASAGADPDRAPRYAFDELAGLLGVARRTARESVARLVAAGHLAWSADAIGFPTAPAGHDPGPEDSIGRGRGHLTIPRRVLRFLARGARGALIAAAIGILLRCLSRRRDGFRAAGRVKAAWIARNFSVDLRAIKQARRELVERGWVAPLPGDPCAENRWGRAFRIDLAWGPSADADGRGRPPRTPTAVRPIATPNVDRDLPPGRNNNQDPARRGPSGVSTGGDGSPGPAGREGNPKPRIRPADPAPPGTVRPPRWRDVRVGDLEDTGRALALFAEATASGLVGRGEADRLRFLGAAEHALAAGRSNPAGLFVHLVRGRLWRHVTQEEEDRAHRRLKAFDRASEPPAAVAWPPPLSLAPPPAARPVPPALSADASAVRRIRASLAAAGYRGDPYPLVRRQDPGWTRERWDRALAELSGPSVPARPPDAPRPLPCPAPGLAPAIAGSAANPRGSSGPASAWAARSPDR